ncbi:MAG: Eco57I restriction-modification methylase domain-containing protein, partial [Selenomonadaceae bacterium]|nr:Eco57I restriction-modification methylase domain-containing protein [Selenomonadaceae bacterium]
VGNPPYQNAAAGDSIRMLPVYNLFMENSFKLADKVSLIHPARWLFNAGATPQEFNERMLNDPHLKVVRYEADGTKFFPTSDIKGGVAITLRDANKNFGAIGTFIPWDEFRSTYQKVVGDNLNFESLSKIVFTPIVYRLSEKFFTERRDLIHKLQKADGSILRTNIFERLPEIFLDDAPADGYEYLKIHGLTKMQRVYKWIRRDYVNAPAPLNKWKVLLPTANGTGEFGETLSKPFVVPPLVVNTETFITVGAFDTEAEADACLKYIKTKFARAMLGILKVTQHATPDKWAKVPLQDFSSASDIDWTKPVAQIDEQLYRKYGLTEDEINFIESHVKAME